MLKLTYIYHDCFLVEAPEATLLFDYWREMPNDYPNQREYQHTSLVSDPEFISRIRRDVPLYIFVSHHHKDHFNRIIFRWKDLTPMVHYIISSDVEKSIRYMLRANSTYNGDKPRTDQVTVLSPGSIYSDERLKVHAFGSTDIGNSYMIEVSGKRLFHAGDLNAWVWKDESTPAEIEDALCDYNSILNTIEAGCGTRIDVAMFPVDSRIGTDYWEGAKMFVRRFDVGVFVPMHFGLGVDADDARRKEQDATRFDAYANPNRGIYAALLHPGDALGL